MIPVSHMYHSIAISLVHGSNCDLSSGKVNKYGYSRVGMRRSYLSLIHEVLSITQVNIHCTV